MKGFKENAFVIKRLPEKTNEEDVESFLGNQFPHFKKIKAKIHIPQKGIVIGKDVIKFLMAFVEVDSIVERDEVMHWFKTFPGGISVTNRENISSTIIFCYQNISNSFVSPSQPYDGVNTKSDDGSTDEKLNYTNNYFCLNDHTVLANIKREYDEWMFEKRELLLQISTLENTLKDRCQMFESEIDSNINNDQMDNLSVNIDLQKARLKEAEGELQEVQENFIKLTSNDLQVA